MDGAHDYHNFQLKLRQRPVWEQVHRYVQSQQIDSDAGATGQDQSPTRSMVPLSINLDLTTACNYRCDHCIDWDILNSKKWMQHQFEQLIKKPVVSLSWRPWVKQIRDLLEKN